VSLRWPDVMRTLARCYAIPGRITQNYSLVFNGWLFENYDDAKTAILGEILDAFKEEASTSQSVKKVFKALYKSVDKLKLAKSAVKYGLDFFLTGGISSLTSLTINKALETVSGKVPDADLSGIEDAIRDELDYKELREDIREFQKSFAELLEESKISRLVVFIDELDRCRPDTILDTLEVVKLFLFTGNAAFVLGADERHIAYAVKSKFQEIEGQEIDIGKEYLEKLVQYPIKIPRLDSQEVETYIGCLLLQSELEPATFAALIDDFNHAQKEDFMTASLQETAAKKGIDTKETLSTAHQLSNLLAQGLNGNPRQCKRFLNMMDLRIKQASYKNKKLDRRVLAKIMMLEYFRVKVYKQMAAMAREGTLQAELSALESSVEKVDTGGEGKTELVQLKEYEKDDWFLSWCHIEPKLGELDLNLYFYFSRTSLEERLSLLTTNLSPAARGLMNQIISPSEAVVKKAIDDAQSISVHDVIAVIDALGSQLLSMSRVDEMQMKSLLLLAESKQEYWADTMNILSEFSVQQLTTELAAYIAAFANLSNQQDKLRELCDGKWATNKMFTRFLKNSLK
jgi:predicted KAP-like P-loop ATPase